MANVLGTDKKIAIIGALTEGSSIRSIERMTGVHRDTIMRLGVKGWSRLHCHEELQHIIRKLHCALTPHRESVPVEEVWQGKTILEGVVEVFHLHGHPETNTAYAWSHDTDDPEDPKRHVTVLHIHPALSPLAVVRAAIARDYYANLAQA